MTSAIFGDTNKADRRPSALVTGVALSLALHVGVAVLVMYQPPVVHETAPPKFVMEMVQLPKPAEPKPPEPKPPEPPRLPAPPQPTPLGLPPPPPPQLTEAPIAEKSVAPPHPGKSAAAAHERLTTQHPPEKSVAAVAPPLPANSVEPLATPVSRERPSRPATGEEGGKIETASQSVQDFILMQIARAWLIDLRSPRFRDISIKWSFTLRPDGTLAAPFGKNDPFDLTKMVDRQTLAQMQQPTENGQRFKILVTTFIHAIQLAQPFRVPPNETSYKDRILPLNFAVADLSQTPPPSATR